MIAQLSFQRITRADIQSAFERDFRILIIFNLFHEIQLRHAALGSLLPSHTANQFRTTTAHLSAQLINYSAKFR